MISLENQELMFYFLSQGEDGIRKEGHAPQLKLSWPDASDKDIADAVKKMISESGDSNSSLPSAATTD
jgi:hypothetical protein